MFCFCCGALCLRKILFQKKYSAAVKPGWSPWPFRAYTTRMALNKQALKGTLPTEVETPPRSHSCEDVQPSPLPHNTIYTASTAHRAPGSGQRQPSLGNRMEGNPQPRCRRRRCGYTALCGLMTDNRPDVIDPGEAWKIHGVKFRFAFCEALRRKHERKQKLLWKRGRG